MWCAMPSAFPRKVQRSPRWLQRQRERDAWLFAAAFIMILITGLIALVALDSLVIAPALKPALAISVLALLALAPPPVLRFVWHAFANHVAVASPRRIDGVRVIDGDTIEDGLGWRYRLANIDAPETGDNAKRHRERERGEEARLVAVQAVLKASLVEVRRTFRVDQSGRRIAFVSIDGLDLGRLLMQAA